MTANMEQVKELCDMHSIKYAATDNNIFINDAISFDANDKLIDQKIAAYIDIIKGRNEMVNTICQKLNTTTEKGCRICKDDDQEWKKNYICKTHIKNSILLDIQNIDHADTQNISNKTYTSYGKNINLKVLIIISETLKYYLVSERQYYELLSVVSLQNVLDQLCTFEKKQCDRNKGADNNTSQCPNMVDIHKDFPNPYGLCNDLSEYMLSTAHGYRNCSSSFSKYHFCSSDCMDHFAKYNRCTRCHEDGTVSGVLSFIEELGHSLCNGRGDWSPGCVIVYNIEKRYLAENKKTQLFNLVINSLDNYFKHSNISFAREFDILLGLIKKNDYRVSLELLTDICYARSKHSLRDRNDESETEIKICSECGCTKHSKKNGVAINFDECYKCNTELGFEFYYNYDLDTGINGLVCESCCDTENSYYMLVKK